MVAHLVNHLARRGVEAASQHWNRKQEFIAHLEQDAQAYDFNDPNMKIEDIEFWPVALTGLVTLFVLWSVCNT